MLQFNPEKRISASDILQHPWLGIGSGELHVLKMDLLISLNNLQKFRTQMILQKAVLAYIASQQITKTEETKIRKLFDILDTDKDGRLTKVELVAGYKSLHGNTKKAKRDAEAILKNLDLYNSQSIEYNGISLL